MQQKTDKISVAHVDLLLLVIPVMQYHDIIHPCSVLFGNLCVDSGLVPSLLVKKTRVGELRT